MDGSFGDDVGVETVAEVNRVDVVTAGRERGLAPSFRRNRLARGGSGVDDGALQPESPQANELLRERTAYHSRSLYMIVKNTCRNRLTALINTANR
jgi:hypothetical protein